MTRYPFVHRGGALWPASQQAIDALRTIRPGGETMISFRPARNLQHHRLLFAMLQLIVEHTDYFSNVEQALVALKIAVGLVDTYVDADTGKTFFIPRSISFEAMSQSEFAAFFERSVYVITARWFPPGTDEADVRAQIEEMAQPQDRRHAAA